MPWFRLDDKFHSHPKVIQAGNEAVGLFTRCGTYAAEHLTDGFIPEHVALLYGSPKLADTLVQAKLWRRTRGGWRMRDFLDYNPSAQQVEKERALKAERQKRWLEARARRKKDASQDASGDGQKDDAPTPTPSPPRREAGTRSPKNSGGARANPPGSPPPEKPPWCGSCKPETRQLELADGTVTRCPQCHPLAPNGDTP